MRDYLSELCATPYFNKDIEDYNKGILNVISYVLDNYSSIRSNYSRTICDSIWTASKYLSGSISSEIPYEVNFLLSNALNDWVKKDCVITTALVNDRDFHFLPYDPWKEINFLLPDFDYPDFDKILIQIALPKLYKHIPLYNVALYHELGHFVDSFYKITETTFLINPIPPIGDANEQKYRKAVVTNHRSEYFADLFAACYTGHANYKFLNEIAPNQLAIDTHPATIDRINVSEDFLNGKTNPIIEMFQNAVKHRAPSELEVKFDAPDLSESFDNIRPYSIENDRELHGMIQASWDFLDDCRRGASEPWEHLDEHEVTSVLNDLLEKSIRNKAIMDKWSYGTTS